MNINRIIHPGFWFGKSDIKEAIELAKAGVGGFCIYFGTRQDVLELTKTLQAHAPRKLLISADYEYGLGRWLKDAPLLPSNISLGAAGNPDFAYKKGYITACQARTLGVNWVFAPVVDLADTPQNPIVNTRSFGTDPKLVSKLARAFMLGLEDGGCLNTLKHFPGHGSTQKDSHLTLPAINKTLAELESHELIPYRDLITKADSIMVAHLKINSWDSSAPTSFSHKIITDYLRKKMHYKGLIITDALVMKATGGLNPVDAFKAGADILLCPDNPLELIKTLEQEIEKDKTLVSRAVEAISAQEMLLAKLNAINDIPCKDPWANECLSQTAAESGIASLGNNAVFEKGDTVYYLEPDIYPATDFKANALLARLKENGINILPYDWKLVDNLIISTFSNYAAFSGHINFTAEQKELVQKAVAAAQKSALISFGSPFVNLGISNLDRFLMAGTQTDIYQTVCADILTGKAKAKGQMPV